MATAASGTSSAADAPWNMHSQDQRIRFDVVTETQPTKTAIAHSSGEFTGLDHVEIFWQQWRPAADADIRGVVLLIHGYAEHSGRYAALATELAEAGFAVGALDHRGHGRSGGKRAQVNQFDDYIDDVQTFATQLRERFPAPVPFFVLGHSMGGLITLRWVTRDHPSLRGIAVSGTAASKPDDVPEVLVKLSGIISRVAPDLGVVDRPLDKISRDPAVVEAYFNDPLNCPQKIRARLGAEMIDAMTATEQALPKVRTPILIMHGGDDAITDPASSQLIADKVGSEDVTLKFYDGLWHEIFNEPEREEVIGDLVQWLRQHSN